MRVIGAGGVGGTGAAIGWGATPEQSPLTLVVTLGGLPAPWETTSVVRVQVTAVTFFHRSNGLSELAQVRYVKARRSPGGAERLTHWIATIEYAWVTPSTNPKSRQWNPLGWRVTDFHTEAESLADTISTSTGDP